MDGWVGPPPPKGITQYRRRDRTHSGPELVWPDIVLSSEISEPTSLLYLAPREGALAMTFGRVKPPADHRGALLAGRTSNEPNSVEREKSAR